MVIDLLAGSMPATVTCALGMTARLSSSTVTVKVALRSPCANASAAVRNAIQNITTARMRLSRAELALQPCFCLLDGDEFPGVDLGIHPKPIEGGFLGRFGPYRTTQPERQLQALDVAIVREIQPVLDRRRLCFRSQRDDLFRVLIHLF